MSEITQSLNPQGYNYGGDPQNVNPFWNEINEGGGIFIPALTQTTNGYVLSWTNNAGLPNPDPVTITNGEDGTPGIDGTNGTDGTDGATFTPHMTATSGGYSLSWTNDKGLPNPDAVIITNGVNGTNGINGQDGADGVTPNITAAATVDNSAGTPGCTVVKTGTDAAPTFTFNFTHIRGEKGDTGEQGPQGEQGVPGQNGADGVTPQITATATVDNTVGTPSVTVTKTGTDAEPNFEFAFSNIKGQPGTPGRYYRTSGALATNFTYMAQYGAKFGMIELLDNQQMPEISYYLMSKNWKKSNDSGMTSATLDSSVLNTLFKTRAYGCSEAGETYNDRKGMRFLVSLDSTSQSGDNTVFTFRFSPVSPYYVKSDFIPVEEITANLDYTRAMPLWKLGYGKAVITLDANHDFVSSDIKIRYVPICADTRTLDGNIIGFNTPLAAAVEEKYFESSGQYLLEESLMLNYKFMGTGYVAESGTHNVLSHIDASMDALVGIACWGV